MSLRKSPQLTPQLLAAARHNAQHSTAPRSAAAEQNSKLNALKHGGYVRGENHHQAMLALGEDPEQFQTLRQELMSAFGPGDARLLIEAAIEEGWRPKEKGAEHHGAKFVALLDYSTIAALATA